MTEQQNNAIESQSNDENREISEKEFENYFASEGESFENENDEKSQDDSSEKNEQITNKKEQKNAKSENSEQNSEKNSEDPEYKPEEYQHNKNYKAAMEAERREKAELKKELARLKEESEKLKSIFERAVTSSNQPEEQPPSFDDNPLDALKYENERTKKELEKLKQDHLQRQEQEKALTNQRQFLQTWQSKAKEFEQSTPDFRQAYNFAIKSRFDEYRAFGYSPQQAEQMVVEDEAAIVANALQNGDNPAEKIYSFARLRGYQANSESSQKVSNQEKFTTMKKGVDASKSISGSGQNAVDSVGLEEIAAMSDEDFDKNWHKVLNMG